MSGSVNKVILVGNVGRDPEIRTSGSGAKIANFSLATSDRWRDRTTNEQRERTEWHRVVVFSEGLVGIIEKYVHKGSKLYLEASLQTRKWTDSNGVDKWTTEVVLQRFGSTLTLLDSRGEREGGGVPVASGDSPSQAPSVDQELDDEVPF